jgi:hypothetical protein
MVLDRAGRRQAAAAPLYSPARWPEFRTWELDAFGLASTAVTGLLVQERGFSDEISQRGAGALPDAAHRPRATARGAAQCGQRTRAARMPKVPGRRVLVADHPEKLQAGGLTEDDSGPAVVATEAAFDAANAALAG